MKGGSRALRDLPEVVLLLPKPPKPVFELLFCPKPNEDIVVVRLSDEERKVQGWKGIEMLSGEIVVTHWEGSSHRVTRCGGLKC